MPPLTWQQVSAPSFSGVAESQRLSADMLSKGFGSAIDAVGTLKESQKSAANGEFLSRIASYGTSEDMRAALDSGALFEGLDRSYITAETFDRADAHSKALLGDIQTGVQTDGFRLDNQGKILDNQNQSMENTQLGVTNARTNSQADALPAAVARANEIRLLQQAGQWDEAATLQGTSADLFSAAGVNINGIVDFVDGGVTTAKNGIDLRTNQRGEVGDVRNFDQENAGRIAAENALEAYGGNQELAKKSLLANDEYPVAVVNKAVEMLGGYSGIAPAAVTGTDYLAEQEAAGNFDSAKPIAPEMTTSALGNKGDLSVDESAAIVQNELQGSFRADQLLSAYEIEKGAKGQEAVALAFAKMSEEQVNASDAEVVSQLGDKVRGAGFDLSGPELINNIRRVTNKYGMTSGQAAALIESSIEETPWVLDLVFGETNANFDRLDKFLAKVYNVDGKSLSEKIAPAIELEADAKQRSVAVETVTNARSAAAATSADYFSKRKLYESNPTPELKAEVALAQARMQQAAKKLEAVLQEKSKRFGS